MNHKRAAFLWVYQGASQRDFRYIYKPGNPSSPEDARTCLHFSNDIEEFQWNLKKLYFNNNYLWITAVYFGLY